LDHGRCRQRYTATALAEHTIAVVACHQTNTGSSGGLVS
jgi:hypothetical protein